MTCKVKELFDINNKEHSNGLLFAIQNAYDKVEDLAKRNRKKFSTSEFYTALLSELKSENTPFKVEYSTDFSETQKKVFKDRFLQIKKAIIEVMPSDYWKNVKQTELNSYLENNFQKDVNAGRLKIVQDETAEGINVEATGAIEHNENVEDVNLKQFLEDTYANCFGAEKQMKNLFAREIFLHTLCNFEKGYLITNNSQLNENIAIYKNELFSRIVNFLSTKNPQQDYPYQIYTDEGYISKGFYTVLSDMQDYINSIENKQQTINTEYSNSLFRGGSEELEAIHAYTILKYFDTLLKETLGNVIQYNRAYKNSEVVLYVSKYQFSKDTEHQRKSWTDSDIRTAIQNTSRFSKFILQSIPLKINGKLTDKTIGVSSLSSTITKIFSKVSRLAEAIEESPEINDLILYLQAYHDSPILYSYKLFDLISNSLTVQNVLRRVAGFTEDDLGVIQSLFEYVYSYDTDMHIKSYDRYTHKSIRAIEYNNLKTSYNLGKYSILSDITGVIDDCMDASYFFSEYGQDGGLHVGIRAKSKDRRGPEKYKDSVNAANISYSQQYREQLKSTCQVEFASKTSTTKASVTIPLSIDQDKLNLNFDISVDNALGILAQVEGIQIQAKEDSEEIMRNIYRLFGEDSPIDLTNSEQISRLICNPEDENITLTADEQLFKQILQFIDDRLLTNFLSRDGLQKFRYFKTLQLDQGFTSYIDDLLIYSVKAQVISDIYYDFNNERLDPKNTRVTSRKDFMNFLKRRYIAFNNLTDQDKKTYFITNNGISNLRTIPSSTTWANNYAQAVLILQGETTASVSKNQNNNNDANYVTAFLGGQIFNVCYKAREAAKESLNVKDQVYADIVEEVALSLELDENYLNLKTEEEAKAYFEQQVDKVVEKMGLPPETAAGALLFTKNSFAIKQCVINSDIKNKEQNVKSIRDLKASELFYNAIVHNFWTSFINTGEYCIQPTTYSDKVKLIQYLIDGKNYKFGRKSLSSMSKEELIELYRTSIGQAAKLSMDNVIYTYKQLWGQNLTLSQINDKLKHYTEQQLVDEAHAKHLTVTADLHYRVKTINGKQALMVNETLEHQAKMFDKEYLTKRLKQEEINFINDLVNSGVFFYIDYHDTSLYDHTYEDDTLIDQLRKSSSPIANIILSVYETGPKVSEYYNKWVRNGKLILAYDTEGNPIVYKNTTSVAEMNPLLERFFYTDSLLSNNLRFQLTGFESNHPDKSKFMKMWGNVAKGLNIDNQLLNNTTWANEKGKIEATGNIDRLQKAKIIWGHPALGKTTYLTGNPDSIIDWDAEFNETRNEFIKSILPEYNNETKQQFLKEGYNYITGNGEFNQEMIPYYEQYKAMIIQSWELVKQKAAKENKKIFASPTILLSMFKDDFDLVLTMNQDTFLKRKPFGLEWKQSIDALLNSDQSIINKTIDVGDLYMYDIMALNDSCDLYQMSRSHNSDVNNLADRLINIVINISQGTQLKRNVIVPATMHYEHLDLLEGIYRTLKVAIIHDMPSIVYNFVGDRGKTDSMDGSALTIAEQSILENKTLGSQEVGPDKKPIWHYYNQKTGTAGLMKFASFEINNERMLLSLDSKVPLIRMYKKMTNLAWANYDEEGNIVSWNTSREVTLGKTTKLSSLKRVEYSLDFQSDIMDNEKLYYRTYNSEGEIVYKQITGFGGDAVNGYYTIESYVDEAGYIDYSMPVDEKVYHYYNSNSDHHTTKQEGDHTINSLYELWLAVGGLYSQSLDENGILRDSEASHRAVVGFINKTVYPKSGAGTDRHDLTQNSYDQPLKPMMISYLTNNSAMKNGAENRNSVDRWFNEENLAYMEMDASGLGIQMDADHDVEEAATLTEPSQVITALEAGGFLHKYAKQVYQDLGRVANIASSMEIDAVAKYLQGKDDNYDEVRSNLYDIIVRSLINGIKTREDQANLTDDILRTIEKKFNKNIDHLQDVFKMPCSDQNLYSQILPTITSLINKKSIKRQFSGSGCVMVPGFNIVQYFVIDGKRYIFKDLVRLALEDAKLNGKEIPPIEDSVIFERALVQNYLKELQLDPKYIVEDVDEFIPTDIVDVMSGDTVLKTIDLDDIKSYYKLMDKDWDYFGIDGSLITNFRVNITSPRNLSPVKITWVREDNGKKMNIFDLKPFRDSYENPNSINRAAVQQAFRDLDKGIFYDPSDVERKNPIKALQLSNRPAELIISDMYSDKFGTKNKTIAEIRDQGVDAFRLEYEYPKESKHYDISFTKVNGDDVYISFNSPKKDKDNRYEAYKRSNLVTEKDDRGNINVYLTNDDNRKLFKVGRYILKKNYSHVDNKFYDENNKQITGKDSMHLKADGAFVYEYVEFVSKYHVVERFTVNGEEKGDIDYTQEYDKYYINIHNIKATFTKTGNNEEDSRTLKAFITSILDEIYATQQFLGIQVNPEISRDAASNIVKYVSNMKNVDNDFRQTVLLPLEKELRSYLDIKDQSIDIGEFLRERYEEFYDKLAVARYSSWEQSLYFTAARIPAQTLQSFMQMEAIAYSGNSRNIVYVSHWQAWLQGSDY